MNIDKLIVMIAAVAFTSCGQEFLEIKRDRNQRIPVSLEDHAAILNAVRYPHTAHRLGLIGADEYYATDGRLTTLTQAYERNAYLWAQDVYEGGSVDDWRWPYQRIMYANLALEGLNKQVDVENAEFRDELIGSALFHRAFNYYHLAQLFCKPYDTESSDKDLGLPLRLETDASVPVSRSSLEQTYSQVISDLVKAEPLLPEKQAYKTQPSRQAVYALLAKIHLQMDDYVKAAEYAESCLRINAELVDFSTIDTTAAYPFADDEGLTNPEVIFYGMTPRPTVMGNRFNIDTTLFASYADDDLRKPVYFLTEADGRITFKGAYSGNYAFFTGLAIDEVLLIRAECLVRQGNLTDALGDLNRLLAHRIKSDQFQPLEGTDQTELLKLILAERKKELLLRGVRWEDLRRLNKDPQFAIMLVREIDGKRYELPPNDPRYAWPLPDQEVAFGSDIVQNER